MTDTDVCAIGKVDDGTLRVCCSTHQHVLCAHHYARSHFVETIDEWDERYACDRPAPRRISGEPPGWEGTRDVHDRSIAALGRPVVGGLPEGGGDG